MEITLTKNSDGKYHCPRCKSVLIPTPGTFAWGGKFFAGLVCEPCNSLFDNPEDSMFEFARTNYVPRIDGELIDGELNEN